MASFSLPPIHDNSNGSWGPSSSAIPQAFRDIPYALYSKADKITHIADWSSDPTAIDPTTGLSLTNPTAPSGAYNNNRGGRGGASNNRRREAYGATPSSAAAFGYVQDEDERSFSLVDGGRSGAAAHGGRGGRGGMGSGLFNSRGRGRGGARGGAARGGAAGAGGRGGRTDGGRGGGRGGRGGWGTYRGDGRSGFNNWDKPSSRRDWSIAIAPDWQMLEEISFTRLQKLAFAVPEPEDLSMHGAIYSYDKTLDSVNTRNEKPLQIIDMVRYNTTTSDDPVISALAEKGEANVYTTDAILSVLMTATRSVNSWDIVIVREGNNLYLDKREGGPFDFLTVNENAADPPADSDKPDSINSPSSLSLEASYINSNFANQVVDMTKRKAFKSPNPFYSTEESEPLASCAYRYRKFDISLTDEVEEEDKVRMVVRTEVDAYQGKKDQYITIKALNEFDAKAQGSGKAPDWRSKLDSQRGAVVATEMKNNSAKLARWTVQSILAGAEVMKLGFISRVNAKDPQRHSIVGVQSHKPKDFANQMAISLNNGWGIVRMIVDLCMRQPEGRYVLIKDPNNTVVRFYSVPANALEAVDEGDDEDLHEDDDEDRE